MHNYLARLFTAFVCVFFLIASPPAAAHDRINSFSHAVMTVTGDTVNYYLNLPAPVVSLLHANVGDDVDDLTNFFGSEIRVTTSNEVCQLTHVMQAPPQKSGNKIVDLLFRCPGDVTDLTITSSAFLDFDESHTQFLRFAPPDNPSQVLHEAVLTESNRVFHVSDVRAGGSASLERAISFAKLGIEHLLTGYDHILFLLTVVVGISFIESLKAVTSFTLAHSLTMALAFLGGIYLPSSIVEPLIAATVIYVAIENVTSRNIRRRWIWTLFFGLVHGLGFVGALKEMTISRSELVLSLVSFNIGIELAQLLVVAIAVVALRYTKRYPWATFFNRGFSTCVGLLGCVWLVQRIMVT
ncbi:MAG: HupE/UreJ family protein [Gammaproteobacteria bacterium]|nr:HupE/UreJ family protein [Gammaproteobacteria bacterium]